MIVFDLCCSKNHVFEAWFGSSDDYDAQKKRGLLSCPLCDDKDIGKVISPVNVPAKGNSRKEAPIALAKGQEPDAAQMRAMMEKLAQAQQQIEASHEDVGDRFVEEVRAMHHGEIDERPILGDATLADAESLNEEGISVMPLPFKRRKRLNA